MKVRAYYELADKIEIPLSTGWVEAERIIRCEASKVDKDALFKITQIHGCARLVCVPNFLADGRSFLDSSTVPRTAIRSNPCERGLHIPSGTEHPVQT